MKKIRAGLFGVGRGTDLAECFMMQDWKINAGVFHTLQTSRESEF